jgi:hypothetical protein
VKYKGKSPVRDTSTLMYKNGLTWYRSKRVERVEAAEGEVIVNHELKSVSLHLSDSIRQILQMELGVKPDKELESALDANFEGQDMAYFKNFVTRHCNVVSVFKDGLDEISITPKNPAQATLLSLKIRFDKNSKVRYYEYVNREVYASDPKGNSRFRIVTTIYDNFHYEEMTDIPSKLTDFIEWNGWTVKLKKYTNYKLSVL